MKFTMIRNNGTAFALVTAIIAILLNSCSAKNIPTETDDILKCMPTGDRKDNVKIIQSEHDKRSYKYITLKNKLRIMLVSDPTAEKSAAAVSIHAG